MIRPGQAPTFLFKCMVEQHSPSLEQLAELRPDLATPVEGFTKLYR